jgi:hypothetical protein
VYVVGQGDEGVWCVHVVREGGAGVSVCRCLASSCGACLALPCHRLVTLHARTHARTHAHRDTNTPPYAKAAARRHATCALSAGASDLPAALTGNACLHVPRCLQCLHLPRCLHLLACCHLTNRSKVLFCLCPLCPKEQCAKRKAQPEP